MKASFNGLRVNVGNIFTLYNLTIPEFKNLKRHFGDKVKSRDGSYSVFDNSNRKITLELFVHEIWIPVEFDITKDLLKLFNSEEIPAKAVEKLSKQLKQLKTNLSVDYSWTDNKWSIVDYDNFLKLLSSLIADL